jgi:AcrR family transcriptional regulator
MSRTDDRILKATLRLVAAEGFDGATTRRIAEAAGVSEPTLFRRFKNKENLVKTAYSKSFEQTVKNMKNALVGHDSNDLRSSLSEAEKQYSDGLSERSVRFIAEIKRILANEGVRQPETRIMHDTLIDYFQAQIDNGNVRAINPRVAAMVFSSVIAFEKVLVKAFHDRDEKDELWWDDFLDIFLYGIANTKDTEK